MILLFTGINGSGKDTAFNMIKKHFSEYERVAIGDAVKEITASMFNIPLNELHDNTNKEKHRHLINKCNEIELAKDPFVFVNQTIQTAHKHLQNGKKVACTGVRLKHEHKKWLEFSNTHSYNLHTILIHRENHTISENLHNIDKEFLEIKYDHKVINTSFEEFEANLIEIIHKINQSYNFA